MLLTTILWGNVGINVLLTLLADSVLAGVSAFCFSTMLITVLGEIVPQAYFSRHALPTASMLAPLLRVYQVLLYPVAKPTAQVLDWLLGPESIHYFQERDVEELLRMHVDAPNSTIGGTEGRGALNFLALDDLPVTATGQEIDPRSILQLPFDHGRPVFPQLCADAAAPFLRQVHASGRKWVVLTDARGRPRLVLDADGFLRSRLLAEGPVDPADFCHRPVLVRNPHVRIGSVLPRLAAHAADDSIPVDVILVWGRCKRVITGTDILGRLLQGIAQVPGDDDRRGVRH